MYVKLFASLYQGTLRGRPHAILVFTNLLAHADQYGIVDKHWAAIAGEVGLTVDEVKAAIAELEAPDDQSRTNDEEGRRIIPVDQHRAWGWRVVNYGKYRSIRNEDDRREQNRQAQERFRKKSKQESATVSQGKPQKAQAEAEAEAEAEGRKSKPLRAALAPVDLPAWLSPEDWQAYREHRGAKFTEKAQTMAIKQLDAWRQQGQDPGAILRQSVMNGWKGLFELKAKNRMPDLVSGLGQHGQATAAAGKAWLESQGEPA